MSIRNITFREAIKEALFQVMEVDKSVFIMGCGVTSPTAIFGSIDGLCKIFSKSRVIETPIAENAISGIAIGAALTGMRPVIVHQRIDFMLLAMDQIVNHAAKWSYMFGGEMSVPLTIRGIIGQGWGQGAQHSQALQALFAHIPGLKVVMPSNPYDAKGLLISSIEDYNPVIFIEHRRLYDAVGRVPSQGYKIVLGKGKIIKQGKDVTVVALSFLVKEAQKASLVLKKENKIDIEIIDPRCVKPLDAEIILESVRKTGRLVVVDPGWRTCGLGAEISALVAERGFRYLKSPIKRISLPEAPTPTSAFLEHIYYPGADNIIQAVTELVCAKKGNLQSMRGLTPRYISFDSKFTGPF